jgi:hypothetical protein
MCALAIRGQQRELSAMATGTPCYVPDDSYVRLGYYLNSVHATSCPESIPSELYSWKSMNVNSHRSTDELRQMLYWSEKYSPITVKQAGYFIMVPPNSLGSANEFVKITADTKRVGLLATNKAVIGLLQRTSQAVDVMFYEKRWEDNHYYNPRRYILQKIRDREKSCSVC